jgi:hypothetical protein
MALLAAGAALIAGCAAQLGSASPDSASTTISITASPARSSGESPQQIARADVSAALRAFVAPPGARRLAGAPAGSAGLFSLPPSGGNDMVTTEWWTYPGTQDQALAWFMSHTPPGTTRTGTGAMDSVPFLSFGRSATALLQLRELGIQVAVHDGSTLLRVDGHDTWRPARPAAAVIPGGVTRLVLTTTPGLNAGGPASVARPLAAVTDPGQVAKVVALVNALPTAPVGVFNCPNDSGAQLVIDFYRGSSSGNDRSPAAVVVDRMGGCGGTELSVRGGPQNVALADSGQQILDLLKVSFPRQVG